jgi:glucosyl-dolichyl phosphate glucuronosyltransferase
MRTEQILASVVVCTYNRAAMLPRALESLVQQTLEKHLFEVIVVDNASSDATPEVLRNLKACYAGCNITLVREDRPGLGYARNTGAREARGTYVAFMDDDARADKDWLRFALDCFESVKPTPLVVGGPIFPFYDSPRPAWFKDEYEIRTWGQKPRHLKDGESFSGSNMILKKEVIEDYGGFGVEVGMKGPYLSVGEETVLLENIWRHGGDTSLYYSPEPVMFHAVPAHKMTISYQLARAFVGGQTLSLCNGPPLFFGRSIYLMKTICSAVKFSGLSLVRARAYPTYQNWIVESLAPIVTEVGRFLGGLGFHLPVKQR